MDKHTYRLLETYMMACMEDKVHDKEHIYRVLYQALRIAKEEKQVDYDVLIGACLLHDIGRAEEYTDPQMCHAKVGSEKAYAFLREHGFTEEYAEHVKQCICTHRFRKDNLPQSLEAKILFDADKLDAAGAIGIARTLMYQGIVGTPLYTRNEDGKILDGKQDEQPSFFQEYKRKLEIIYSRFYTEEGQKIAMKRQQAAVAFFESLYEEIVGSDEVGNGLIKLEE